MKEVPMINERVAKTTRCPACGRRDKAKLNIIVKMPIAPVLCGDDWLREHLNDHTAEEIGALTIMMACGDNQLPPVSVADKKGKVMGYMKSLKGAA
jgi:hypothetical protein